MFAVTNIHDMLVLAVFFGRSKGDPSSAVRVIIGQYLGFTAILAVSVLGALGASLLPDTAIPYLGLFPCFSAFVPLGMYGVPATIPAVIPKPRRSPVPV